jgi:hypothetical protein
MTPQEFDAMWADDAPYQAAILNAWPAAHFTRLIKGPGWRHISVFDENHDFMWSIIDTCDTDSGCLASANFRRLEDNYAQA